MSSRKLLIADSDIGLVESLARHFRASGFEVKTAYDALTILKLVHLEAPDAFVLGADLTCDNGVCVCEMLSSERRFNYMPAVLLTEQAEDWLKHDCHDLHAVYVPKGERLSQRVFDAVAALESREPVVVAES